MTRAAYALLGLLAAAGPAAADEKSAAQALEKMGADVMHVGLDPAKPVFHVDFGKNPRFSDADLRKAVPYLKQFPDLRRVTVGFTKVTDKGLEALKELPNLEEVSLPGTKVTDAGLKHLKGLKKLQSVNAVMTKVTDAGAADLKKALPKVEVITRIGK